MIYLNVTKIRLMHLKCMKALQNIPLELVFWITALILLASATPSPDGTHAHFTLCPLANLGLDWCPGCGLGRSLTQLFHGNIRESVKLHWFGIPALLIIFSRILTLLKLHRNKRFYLRNKENKYV